MDYWLPYFLKDLCKFREFRSIQVNRLAIRSQVCFFSCRKGLLWSRDLAQNLKRFLRRSRLKTCNDPKEPTRQGFGSYPVHLMSHVMTLIWRQCYSCDMLLCYAVLCYVVFRLIWPCKSSRRGRGEHVHSDSEIGKAERKQMDECHQRLEEETQVGTDENSCNNLNIRSESGWIVLNHWCWICGECDVM